LNSSDDVELSAQKSLLAHSASKAVLAA